MPYLSGITIYPVKSLDGLGLNEATVLPNGALMHDRRWRLVDEEGAVVNAKKNVRFHCIRANFGIQGIEGSGGIFNSSGNSITLSVDTHVQGGISPLEEETFPLVPGSDGPCGWLSEALAIDVFLQERVEGGFPDDREAEGATLVSGETLHEVARWFDWSIEESRHRLRMNLEVSSGEEDELSWCAGPFWEDVIHSPQVQAQESDQCDQFIDIYKDVPSSEPRKLTIGSTQFFSRGHCRRCVVTSRDSQTGNVTQGFRDIFESRRTKSLRTDIDARMWGSMFRCGLNTAASLAGPKQISVGDRLHVSG